MIGGRRPGAYDQVFPCPNGLGIDYRAPQECWSYRERVAKARRDAMEHDKEIRIREAAGELKPKQIEEDIQEIREWLISVFNHQLELGSRESKTIAAS
jgi:hypothetical protein